MSSLSCLFDFALSFSPHCFRPLDVLWLLSLFVGAWTLAIWHFPFRLAARTFFYEKRHFGLRLSYFGLFDLALTPSIPHCGRAAVSPLVSCCATPPYASTKRPALASFTASARTEHTRSNPIELHPSNFAISVSAGKMGFFMVSPNPGQTPNGTLSK